MSDKTSVVCSTCQAPIGFYQQGLMDGKTRTYLRLGNVILESAHGTCACCGAEWHWSFSDQLLKDLIDRVIKLPTC
jgi:hypothetical protein